MSYLHVSASIATLDRDWEHRHATSLVRLEGVPALTGDELIERIRTMNGRARDALFLALIAAAQRGEAGAIEVILRTMRPAVLVAARKHRRVRTAISLDEAVDVALSALCGTIATYPVNARRKSVATNLRFGIQNTIAEESPIAPSHSEIPTDPEVLGDMIENTETTTPENPFQAIVKVLAWAADHEVLTRDEIRILATWELGTPEDRSALSRELGSSQQALRQRSYRARRRLHDAVLDFTS